MKWMAQITDCVYFMHKNNIVHKDLQPANILIDRDGDAFLTDMGLAKGMQTDRRFRMSTNGVGMILF